MTTAEEQQLIDGLSGIAQSVTAMLTVLTEMSAQRDRMDKEMLDALEDDRRASTEPLLLEQRRVLRGAWPGRLHRRCARFLVMTPTRTPSSRMRRSSGTRFRHSPAARRITAGIARRRIDRAVAGDGLEIVVAQLEADRSCPHSPCARGRRQAARTAR